MIKIIRKRGSGKTVSLMKVAKQNNAKFVCFNPRIMKVKASDCGFSNLKCISYSDYWNTYRDDKVVIDELSLFKHFLSNTLTSDTLDKELNVIGFSDTEEDNG